jgi:hypothetical protein
VDGACAHTRSSGDRRQHSRVQAEIKLLYIPDKEKE